MRLRQNNRLPQPPPEDPGLPGPALGPNPDRTPEQAADLITAGRNIINAALSGNSQDFLRANQQQGGQ